MWKTLRRKRATIASHAELSFRRHRSMSSPSEGAELPSSKGFLPAATDDRGIPEGGQTSLFELGFARHRPRRVPVAARILRGGAEEQADHGPGLLLEVIVVDLGIAALAPAGELVEVEEVVEPDVRRVDHGEDVLLRVVEVLRGVRADLEPLLHGLGESLGEADPEA